MPFALVVGQLKPRDVAEMITSIPPFPYDEVTEAAIDTTMRTTLGSRPPQRWTALDCVDASRGTAAVFDMRGAIPGAATTHDRQNGGGRQSE